MKVIDYFKKIIYYGLWIGVLYANLNGQDSASGSSTIWFTKPAAKTGPTYIEESFPIGAGRLGALVTCGTYLDLLRLNDITLWTGGLNPTGVYETLGAYVALGDLKITQPGHEAATNYRRELNLADSQVSATYELKGVTFRREYFASHPAQMIVARFTADKSEQHSGTIELMDSHGSTTTAVDNKLTFAGKLSNGLKYETQVLVIPTEGTVTTKEGRIIFQNCSALTFYIVAGTDYVMDFSKGYRGEDPSAKLTAQLEKVTEKTFEELLSEHQADFHKLFNRCSIDLGSSTPEQSTLPTPDRRIQASKVFDPDFEELLFSLGRYLMISCSRPGSLPANLQGLWNDQNSPPWFSDYHTNINIQMNYWPAEPTNLAECHQPLFDMIQSQLEPWRKTTQSSDDLKTPAGALPTRGWTVRTSHNPLGGMGWEWDKTSNAWYGLHFWEHYAFGLDKTFLQKTAYPLMKEVCEFWEDQLKTLPDGRLVVPNAWSPEQGPKEDGVSYSQQILWDLFNNYVEASQALGVDEPYRNKIREMRDKLVKPQVGSWGQLLEWMNEKIEDPVFDKKGNHHRHTSHLFAVFPGRQIGVNITPEWAKAALVSLIDRGDVGDVREWSFAWRASLYARLKDPELAHRQIMQFCKETTPNLFGNHPPMQIDGNFGITAGIAEILLQSHENKIVLLPSIPQDWKSGSAKGLRARGGFTVDMIWKEGALHQATITSPLGGITKVSYKDKEISATLTAGQKIVLNASLEIQK